jgi:hypothetical protein
MFQQGCWKLAAAAGQICQLKTACLLRQGGQQSRPVDQASQVSIIDSRIGVKVVHTLTTVSAPVSATPIKGVGVCGGGKGSTHGLAPICLILGVVIERYRLFEREKLDKTPETFWETLLGYSIVR